MGASRCSPAPLRVGRTVSSFTPPDTSRAPPPGAARPRARVGVKLSERINARPRDHLRRADPGARSRPTAASTAAPPPPPSARSTRSAAARGCPTRMPSRGRRRRCAPTSTEYFQGAQRAACLESVGMRVRCPTPQSECRVIVRLRTSAARSWGETFGGQQAAAPPRSGRAWSRGDGHAPASGAPRHGRVLQRRR